MRRVIVNKLRVLRQTKEADLHRKHTVKGTDLLVDYHVIKYG